MKHIFLTSLHLVAVTFIVIALSGVTAKAQNPVWNHVYDSVNLIVTNLQSNVQTKFFSKTGAFSVVVTSGDYNMYMSTKDPRAVESYMHFTANVPTATLPSATPIILPSDSKQAVILVTKTSVDSSPTLTIGSKSYSMYNGGNYYYAYVLATTQIPVKVTLVIGGKQSTKDIVVTQKNRYLVANPVNATIQASDPIATLIQL